MKKSLWLLILLLVLGAWLRFNRLSELLYFNMDEERDAFIVKRILVNHHFTLIGGAIPGGIYLGPAFYYLTSLPFLISKLNPVGLGIAASTLGVFSIWLIFKVGEKLFNYKVGLIAAALFSSSYLMIVYNRHFWPLTPAPIASLLTVFSLYQIIKKKFLYCFLLAGALILGIQSDASNLTLLLLTIICWWVYRLPIRRKEVILAIILVVFSHLPLVFFDLRHDFLNSKAIIRLLSFRGERVGQVSIEGFKNILTLLPDTFSRLIYTFGDRDVSRQLAPCSKYVQIRNGAVPKVLFIFSSLILIFWIYKGLWLKKTDKEKAGLKIISLLIIITFTSVVLFNLFFPAYIREYFISVLFPIFILIQALTLESYLLKKSVILTSIFILILMFFNTRAVLTTTNFLGQNNKTEAINYSLQDFGNEPFFVESLSSCFRYNGIRYLFYLAGNEPANSFMDSYYTWLYDNKPLNQVPSKGAVFVSLDKNETPDFWQQYSLYLPKTTARKQFGGIEVFIIDNEK